MIFSCFIIFISLLSIIFLNSVVMYVLFYVYLAFIYILKLLPVFYWNNIQFPIQFFHPLQISIEVINLNMRIGKAIKLFCKLKKVCLFHVNFHMILYVIQLYFVLVSYFLLQKISIHTYLDSQKISLFLRHSSPCLHYVIPNNFIVI